MEQMKCACHVLKNVSLHIMGKICAMIKEGNNTNIQGGIASFAFS